MVNSNSHEVFPITSEKSSVLVIKPALKMYLIVILLSSMLVVFFFLLVFLPPMGSIIGFLGLFFLLLFNIHIFTLRIVYTDSKLDKKSLLKGIQIDLPELVNIKRMKVLGTVANVPMMVRSVEFVTKSKTYSVNFVLFDYQEIIDLITVLHTYVEE